MGSDDDFADGVRDLLESGERTRHELERIARVSFDLKIAKQRVDERGVTEYLLLTHNKDFSLRKEDQREYQLGFLTFTQDECEDPIMRAGRACARSELAKVGRKLEGIIKLYERPHCLREAHNGEAIAIWLPYFQILKDANGPLAPASLTTYRTGDRASAQLLRKLTQ